MKKRIVVCGCRNFADAKRCFDVLDRTVEGETEVEIVSGHAKGADALAEAYETMREVAQSFDYDSMQFVIQSLEEYKLPPDESKRFSEIKTAAAKPDWEKVHELLAG